MTFPPQSSKFVGSKRPAVARMQVRIPPCGIGNLSCLALPMLVL